MNINKKYLVDSFIKYIKVETTANPGSTTCPSSPGQLALGDILAEDCKALGLSDVKKDRYGFVTATLPSNTDKTVPTIGFIAHMDTSDAFCGKNVNPKIVENYKGGDIALGAGLTLSPTEFPSLNDNIGLDLIVTDGTTLLGADNKSGIVEILAAMEFLLKNPQIKHGDIKVAFTIDEEIGTGAKNFDVASFGADFAYTLDSAGYGNIVTDCFNAAHAKIQIKGKSVHPGTAKDILVNANLIVADVINAFPKDEVPEKTDGYEGFFMLSKIKGEIEKTTMHYIIRDHSKEKFENRKKVAQNIVDELNKKHDGRLEIEIHDQYFNFKDELDKNPKILDLAKSAMEKAGIKVTEEIMRGGTDGSVLTRMGLPCPNIFCGGYNFHGPYEYIPIQYMVKAAEVVVNICELNS
ncbi:MAG: peptidase T [Defluviitaleaceae bacterium]|nr:peptidase T [Defluviitaleaceae bacterium]